MAATAQFGALTREMVENWVRMELNRPRTSALWEGIGPLEDTGTFRAEYFGLCREPIDPDLVMDVGL